MGAILFGLYTLVILGGWLKFVLTNDSLSQDATVGGSVLIFVVWLISMFPLASAMSC